MNSLLTNDQTKIVIVLLVIWEVIWKYKGMWKAAKNNNQIVFGLILIFNTLGLLPLGYLAYLKYYKKVK